MSKTTQRIPMEELLVKLQTPAQEKVRQIEAIVNRVSQIDLKETPVIEFLMLLFKMGSHVHRLQTDIEWEIFDLDTVRPYMDILSERFDVPLEVLMKLYEETRDGSEEEDISSRPSPTRFFHKAEMIPRVAIQTEMNSLRKQYEMVATKKVLLEKCAPERQTDDSPLQGSLQPSAPQRGARAVEIDAFKKELEEIERLLLLQKDKFIGLLTFEKEWEEGEPYQAKRELELFCDGIFEERTVGMEAMIAEVPDLDASMKEMEAFFKKIESEAHAKISALTATLPRITTTFGSPLGEPRELTTPEEKSRRNDAYRACVVEVLDENNVTNPVVRTFLMDYLKTVSWP